MEFVAGRSVSLEAGRTPGPIRRIPVIGKRPDGYRGPKVRGGKTKGARNNRLAVVASMARESMGYSLP